MIRLYAPGSGDFSDEVTLREAENYQFRMLSEHQQIVWIVYNKIE